MNNETQICPTCKQRIDPGAGYRLLSIGEIRTAGDEFYQSGGWRSIRNVWLSRALKSNSSPTRRKISAAPVPPAIDPEEGFRLLSVGEIRSADDESFTVGRGWNRIRSDYVRTSLKTNSSPTRRKIESPVLPPYPGEGYRFLSLGEIFRVGDEVLAVNQVWHPILLPYDGAHMKPDSRPTRRKIGRESAVPGPGYKVLSHGERIHPRDEYYDEGSGAWIITSRAGETIDDGTYRRKIPVSSHDHATDSGQRACPVCSGKAVVGHVGIKPTVPQPKVCPGFGYRLLEIGEVIRKSDEAFAEGRWQSYEDEGQIFDGKLFFFPRRRKIEVDPGFGYRLLADGEMILKSDQYHSTGGWITTSFAGGQAYADSYRRKIEVPTATWIVTDEPGAVWMGRSIGTVNLIYPGAGFRLLAPNEILEVGDELFSTFANQWEKFFPQTVGMSLCPGITARRRIPPALPDPGAGYRWLKVGETIRASDEVFLGGEYETDPSDHGKIFDGVEYFIPRRRKLEIPKQYRLLAVGEMTRNTDEIWVWPTGHILGFWKKFDWGFSVVTTADPPVRREIDSYIGGPA